MNSRNSIIRANNRIRSARRIASLVLVAVVAPALAACGTWTPCSVACPTFEPPEPAKDPCLAKPKCGCPPPACPCRSAR